MSLATPRRLRWLRLDEPGFQPSLAQLPGLVLVVFGRRSCHACRFAHARLPELAEGIVDALVEVDVEASGGLAREFDVFHLPAMFLYRDGQFHAPVDCMLTAPALRVAVGAVLEQPALDPP